MPESLVSSISGNQSIAPSIDDFEIVFRNYPRNAEALPPVVIESGEYCLRFASSPAELNAILKLRFDVYNLEMGEGLKESYLTQRDADVFDTQCHHIYVQHKASGACVGTYRLQTAAMAGLGCGFYTGQEFCLERLPPQIQDEAVEVGRACIGRAHRKGQVLQLLWKGLANYLVWNKKRYLFGACSLPGQDKDAGMALYGKLTEEGFLNPALRIEPRPGWFCRTSELMGDEVIPPPVPRLLQGYLSLGGSICGEPALDRSFNTIDFLVLLDTEAMPPGIFRRFLA